MMLDVLKAQFKVREDKVLRLIEKYNQQYHLGWNDIGIFGSYAREEANATSDIDFCIVADKPDAEISGSLREEADALVADIIFATKEQLLYGECLLYHNIRKDMKFVKGGEFFEKQLL